MIAAAQQSRRFYLISFRQFESVLDDDSIKS